MEEAGVLDSRTAKALRELATVLPSIRLETFIATRGAGCRLGSGTSEKSFPTAITIYGPRGAGGSVGLFLSQERIYLQEPDRLHPNTIYINPHILSWEEDAKPQPLGRRLACDAGGTFEDEIEVIFRHSDTLQLPGIEPEDFLDAGLRARPAQELLGERRVDRRIDFLRRHRAVQKADRRCLGAVEALA